MTLQETLRENLQRKSQEKEANLQEVEVVAIEAAAAKALVEVNPRRELFTAKIPPRTTTALILRILREFQLFQTPLFSLIQIFLPKVAILNIF